MILKLLRYIVPVLFLFCSVAGRGQGNAVRCDSTVSHSYKIERCYDASGRCVATTTSKRNSLHDEWRFVRKVAYSYEDNTYAEIQYDWFNAWIPQKKMVSFSRDGEHVSEEYEMDSASGQWQGILKSVHFDKPDSTQQAAPVFVWSKDENKWVEKKPTQTNEYLQQTEKFLALGWCRTAQWYYSEYKRLFNDENADIEAQLSQCQNAPNAEENEITTLYWAKDEKRRECKEKIEEYLQKEYCQLADWYYKELMQYSTQEDTLLKNRIRDCSRNKRYDSTDVFIKVEKMPEYPSGVHGLYSYIVKKAEQMGMNGSVVVQFVVSPHGELENLEILRPSSPSNNAKAIEIITNLPEKFIPGEQAGEKVPVRMKVPVYFLKSETNNHGNTGVKPVEVKHVRE